MAFAKPDEFLSRVELIDAQALAAGGFTTILLDVDNTLVPRDTEEIPASVAVWVEMLKAQGLRICLLSNNWHKTVFTYAHILDVPLVYKAMKPMPFAFLRAIKKAGGSRRSAVCIGDQLLTDVLGAHLLRMRAILVLPQASKDLAHTRILRRIERLFMRGVLPTR